MWPDRRLCQKLGLSHPIIQAPMAGSATPELAAAVSEAGGLGSLGCSNMTVEEIRVSTNKLRTRSNRPFNLNFFANPAPQAGASVFAATRERLKPWYAELGLGEPPDVEPERDPGFTSEKLSLLLELRPAVVSFHFGLPEPDAVARLKSAGIFILCTATTVAEARALEAAGIDAIIAQGWEAGGHRGSHKPATPWEGVGTLALLPQVVDAVSLPVIAAGGIGDGRGIAAALALGAAGVQLGTAFLSCPEAATDAPRRALLRNASDTDTMVTDAISGRVARTVKSRFAEAMENRREPLPPYGALYALTDPLTGAGRDDVANFHLYGQAAALSVELPAAELVAKLVRDAEAAIARLSAASSD
jgi:nitronate monooxygenase